ncbi:transposase family protein [Dyadobacter sp. LJ53]|uniref:transposase family protein n=1 Tax=Dyadobacter chenwenxiniae TaxID=2906456 RepID=UPI001F21395F|nr:transposase family protein [Dyadobacter chenwenxiniae]MCF0048424.1 transposase family protein [Dyadobacter chenwenxiniae]
MKLGEVKINFLEGKVLVNASSLQKYSRCPLCKKRSKSIHSYYQRQLADLPVSMYQVKIKLRSRRCMCRNHVCPRKIFTERFCSELSTYSRRLQRSRDLLTKIGLELGGVKAAMVSRWVGSCVSAATVIRMIKSFPVVDSRIPAKLWAEDDLQTAS